VLNDFAISESREDAAYYKHFNCDPEPISKPTGLSKLDKTLRPTVTSSQTSLTCLMSNYGLLTLMRRAPSWREAIRRPSSNIPHFPTALRRAEPEGYTIPEWGTSETKRFLEQKAELGRCVGQIHGKEG